MIRLSSPVPAHERTTTTSWWLDRVTGGGIGRLPALQGGPEGVLLERAGSAPREYPDEFHELAEELQVTSPLGHDGHDRALRPADPQGHERVLGCASAGRRWSTPTWRCGGGPRVPGTPGGRALPPTSRRVLLTGTGGRGDADAENPVPDNIQLLQA